MLAGPLTSVKSSRSHEAAGQGYLLLLSCCSDNFSKALMTHDRCQPCIVKPLFHVCPGLSAEFSVASVNMSTKRHMDIRGRSQSILPAQAHADVSRAWRFSQGLNWSRPFHKSTVIVPDLWPQSLTTLDVTHMSRPFCRNSASLLVKTRKRTNPQSRKSDQLTPRTLRFLQMQKVTK